MQLVPLYAPGLIPQLPKQKVMCTHPVGLRTR
jgi:hypothetical protein